MADGVAGTRAALLRHPETTAKAMVTTGANRLARAGHIECGRRGHRVRRRPRPAPYQRHFQHHNHRDQRLRRAYHHGSVDGELKENADENTTRIAGHRRSLHHCCGAIHLPSRGKRRPRIEPAIHLAPIERARGPVRLFFTARRQRLLCRSAAWRSLLSRRRRNRWPRG